MIKAITTILLLAVAGSVFILYTRPAYDRTKEVQDRITQYDEALERARELQELKSALLSRYNTFAGAQLDRLRKMLPDHVDNVRLVLDLDSLAARYGMAIQNVVINRGPSEETSTIVGTLEAQGERYDSLTLQFATAASYPNFVQFMEDLERSLRIVDIVGLSMSRSNLEGGSAEEPLYDFEVTIQTYWLK